MSFTDEIPSTAASFSLPMALSKFDPALGTLAEVQWRVTAQDAGGYGAENLTDVPLEVSMELSLQFTLTGGFDPTVRGSASAVVRILDSYDGTTDFAGRSGDSIPTSGGSADPRDYTNPAELAFFTGPEGNPGSINLLAETTLACTFSIDDVVSLGDQEDIASFCGADVAVQVEVTYIYGTDCNDNGIADFLEICTDSGAGPGGCAEDCNENGVPDECEDDCDEDGIPDDCDPDSCEPVDLACEEFDRFENLTPNDTLSVITSQHNPQQEQGYLCVYAVNGSGQGIGADFLIGQQLVVDGLDTLQYSINAVDYRAAVGAGELTDVDTDGIRDLDGNEYEKTAGEILVPRFLGSDDARQTRGELILIGLSGGTQFDTTADFLIYNDDEDAFSASHTFYCWDKVDTLDVSNVFENEWLQLFSGQNPSKSLGNLEYGWFRVEGGVASSSFFSLLDPAIYAVYVEKVGSTAAADLPFEVCTQSGHLLPRTVAGDNSEVSGAPSDEDCAVNHSGRKPGSLLLYPEFDNRNGVATVVTVTNASESDDVRTHFVYIGRFGN